MIVCVAASPSVDKLFEVGSLTHGEIHRPLEFLQVPGGKGLNVARAVHVLGEPVIVAGLLAGHVGRWVRDSLSAEGVEGRFAWARGETRSSLSVADRDTGRLTEFYEAGSPITVQEWRGLERVVGEVIAGASWLCISGSLPPGSPDEGYGALVRAAHEAGVPVAVDARGEPLARAIEAGPELVKINVAEAEELLGGRVTDTEEALVAAAEIRRRAGGWGHAAVVTMGVDGSVLIDPDGAAWHGRLYTRGRYPVGSGDSFLAGLVTALRRGEPWRAALSLGLGAATANAHEPGAGRLDARRAGELAGAAELVALSGERATR